MARAGKFYETGHKKQLGKKNILPWAVTTKDDMFMHCQLGKEDIQKTISFKVPKS
jgi:hypothetical protein